MSLVSGKEFLAVTMAVLFLSACQSEDASLRATSAVVSRLPAALQGVSSSDLTVVVWIDGDRQYRGEVRNDGSWVVRLDLPALNATYQYRARWTVRVDDQVIPLLEQSGSFFADATVGQASGNEEESLSQGANYDSDCDGQSNLTELATGNDPLDSSACATTSQVAPTVTPSTGAPSSGAPSNGLEIRLPQMQAIRASCFDMGSPASYEYRAANEVFHQVCIDRDFEIGKYEVTYGQYLDFATAPGTPQQVPSSKAYSTLSHPVVMVTLADAIAYTQWLSQMTGDTYRLATEAEWEFAARAGTTTMFWTGNTIRGDQENINSEDPYGGGVSIGFSWGRVLEVGSLEPNPWGLYDMLGNAVEWTCSGYDAEYGLGIEEVCADTSPEKAVIRGGTHYHSASGARASHRYPTDPSYRDFETSFRVVRE